MDEPGADLGLRAMGSDPEGNVVGLDVADGVFEPDTTEMRAQWKPRALPQSWITRVTLLSAPIVWSRPSR